MRNELVVLLPAYNEEENIEKMVNSWQAEAALLKERFDLQLQIVVINDGSTDHTKELAEGLSQQFSNVTLVNHEHNKGLGAAVLTGLRYAWQSETCAFACLMDCDNTQSPEYIGSMLEKMGRGTKELTQDELDCDVVIASRYRKGSKVQGVAGYRLLTSKGARLVYSMLFHVPGVRDYTCGYRLYTQDILNKGCKRFGDALVSETGFTCMAEVLYKLYVAGARFGEVPFVLRYDFKEGASKMKVLKTAKNSFRLAFSLKKLKK